MRRARRPRLRGATTKAMPVSIVLGAKRRVIKQSGDLRGARSDPRPARVGDRAPAPPAPEGLAGLRIASYAAHVSGPPADVVVFMNTGTKSFLPHQLQVTWDVSAGRGIVGAGEREALGFGHLPQIRNRLIGNRRRGWP